MISKIIDGIVEAINQEFGEDYEIYTESIEQGLTEPCFFILCLNPTSDLFFGKRYKRTNQFIIQYFPSSNEKNKECFDIQERLFHCLEVITIDGDLTRGTKMNGEIVDGVLNFQINFDMFIHKVNFIEAMETYKTKTNIKKE